MTENADVEWLRREVADCPEYWLDGDDFVMPLGKARRLLTHIDQLEAETTKFRAIDEEHARLAHTQKDRRPTIHEIAAGNMQGIMARGTGGYASWQDAAVDAYDAAAAIVAEGRRRDEQR